MMKKNLKKEPQFLKAKKLDKSDLKIVNIVGRIKKSKLMLKNKVKAKRKVNNQRKNLQIMYPETAQSKMNNKWD